MNKRVVSKETVVLRRWGSKGKGKSATSLEGPSGRNLWPVSVA